MARFKGSAWGQSTPGELDMRRKDAGMVAGLWLPLSELKIGTDSDPKLETRNSKLFGA